MEFLFRNNAFVRHNEYTIKVVGLKGFDSSLNMSQYISDSNIVIEFEIGIPCI
jgi:SepF-like predicted cell division protein (DUF552 family)